MAIFMEHITSENNKVNDLAQLKESILAAAKSAEENGRHDKLVIELENGYYYLTEPFVLSGKENPELKSVDITLRAKPGRPTVLESWRHAWGKDFTPVAGKPGYYTYQFEKDENGKYPLFHEVNLNGSPIERAKSPVWINHGNLTEDEKSGKVKREGFYVPLDIAKTLAEGEIGSTELLLCVEWEYAILHVGGVDLEKTKTIGDVTHALVTLTEEDEDFFCKRMGRLSINNRNTWFQNSPAFLTEPNTFAYDYKNGVIHVLVGDEKIVPDVLFSVEYPTLENLICLEDVSNVTIENLSFKGVTSKHVCENPVIAGQANNLRGIGRLKHAAILADTVRDLTVKGCTFQGIGTNGVQVINFSVGVTVENCIFEKVGMCGVTIGNPSWHWEDPKNRTFAARIENNYFEHIAFDYPAAPAIYVAQVDGLKMLHNTVESCAYSSVSVGWNWDPQPWELGEQVNIRDAEIAYNYFHNYMEVLRDGGAIYVLGSNCNRFTTSDRFNRMHDNFAMLDELVVHGAKYGYYLDGSSSNWEVYDSVVINTHYVPIFSQPHPQALSYHNTFRNIYSTTERHPGTHVPTRDVILIDYHLELDDPDALFAKYPEVTAIRDAAGCKNLI